MGLDISFARTEYEYAFRAGSYSGFGEFRDILALEDEIVLSEMDGYGGTKSWFSVDSALKPLLNHSDCDGNLYADEVENMIPRMKEIVGLWESGYFQYNIRNPKKKLTDNIMRYYANRLREWIDACERIVDNQKEGIYEYLAFG